MDKCNDEDEIISLSSGSSFADDQDKDPSARDFPEADVDVDTLFSDIKVCKITAIPHCQNMHLHSITVGVNIFFLSHKYCQ